MSQHREDRDNRKPSTFETLTILGVSVIYLLLQLKGLIK
jgi:hypothetical protein